jgi:hypothetical protein
MPTHKAGLLFINKTSSSRSLSNSKSDADLKEIHKHVQKSRDFDREKEIRRQARKARLSSYGWAPIRVAPRIAAAGDGIQPPPVVPSDSTNRLTDIATKPDIDRDKDDKGLAVDCIAKRHGDYAVHPGAITPRNSSLEPFGQFRVPMNSEKHQVLDCEFTLFLNRAHSQLKATDWTICRQCSVVYLREQHCGF